MRYFPSSMVQYSQRLAPAPQQGWRFDLPSAIFGAAATLLLILLAYIFRDRLQQIWEGIAHSLTEFRHRLQAGVEGRYRELVAARARSLTTPAHDVAPLDAIFVEPELLVPSPGPQSASGTDQLHAESQTLPLYQILGGHPKLAILGPPGAGRTAALACLALTCATGVAEREDYAGGLPEAIQERFPLHVFLPAMDWDEDSPEGEQKSDGTGRLLESAVAAVGGSSGMVKLLRQHLEAGQAIVLADGWDELPTQQRPQAATWLAALVDSLPGNLWLVSAGTRDYAPLTEAGFIPLTLVPWDTRRLEAFARRWAGTWATPGDEITSILSRDLATVLRRAARKGALPLELALQAFVVCSDLQSPTGRAALFDRVLDLLLEQEQEQEEKPWLPAACRSVLGQVALELQQKDRATASREEIAASIEAALPPSEERASRAATHILRTLTGRRGLLRSVGPGRYAFVHPLWQAYLAARQLVAADPADLVEQLENPQWSGVWRFYAELGDMGPLVAAWLRTPDDMFFTRLCTLSSWISAAPVDATWHDGSMAVLARTFLQATAFPPTRRKLARALAATGVSGVAYLFKQALQHPNAELRTAAVLGLADVASEADLPSFELALHDEDPAVREAAVHALASLDSDAAKQQLEQVLREEDDTLRSMVAKVLIKHREESVDLLREMAESEDVMVRRAAASGLAEARARGLLEKMMREDDQWIVRTAAATALEEMERKEEASGVAPIPSVEQLPWLISWAASQGEGVGLGEAAQHMLRRALREGDDSVRLAAAQMLTQIGHPDDVESLKAMLANPDPDVAEAAFEALAEISRRYDLSIKKGSG